MAPDPSLFLSPLPPVAPPDDDGAAPVDEPVDRTAPPGGRRLRRVLAPLVAAALVLGAVVANRIGAGGEPVGSDAALPTTTAVDPRRADPPSSTTTSTTLPSALTTVDRLGPLLPEPSGTTLVLAASERVLVADLDTGSVRTAAVPGAEVWGGAPFADVLPVGSALLVGGAAPRLLERGPGGGAVAAGPPMTGGLLPSAVDGRWWALDHRFSVELVERDATGETGRRLSLPGESGVILPFGDGFLVSPAGSVLAVDATTGRARRIADGSVVAADDRTLVRTRCDEDLECGLVLSDHGGGGERLVGTPTPRSRYETYAGVRFSPDGRWLVVPFYGEDQPGGLVLIDVERGERRPLDYLAGASAGGFPVTGLFTADSRWLLVADPSDVRRPIKALRIEDGAGVDIALAIDGGGDEGGTSFLAVPSVPGDRSD